MNRKLIIDSAKPNTVKEKIACGILFITISFDTDARLRFFFNVSKGGCESNLQGIAKLLTILYNDKRFDNERIIEELSEITCKACMRMKGGLNNQEDKATLGNSCCDTIARVLKLLEIKDK